MPYKTTALPKVFDISKIVTVHYFEYKKDFYFAGESHNFWEFVYVDYGSVEVYADDKKYILNEGDVIFHKPLEFHSIRACGNKAPNLLIASFVCDSKDMKYFYEFHTNVDKRAKEQLKNLLFEAKQAFITPLNDPAIEEVILSDKDTAAYSQSVLIYLELFLISIYRLDRHIEAPKLYEINFNTHTDMERINNICTYLEDHIYENIRIDDICKKFLISRASLFALFKKEKNSGVIDYFIRLKIDLAKKLIRESNQNITGIALSLSFSSVQYFSKQFKKYVGISPVKYAKSIREIF